MAPASQGHREVLVRLEHLIYFSQWLILLVVPSHPIHMLYVMQRTALTPAQGHSGFDQLVLEKEGDTRMSIDPVHQPRM